MLALRCLARLADVSWKYSPSPASPLSAGADTTELDLDPFMALLRDRCQAGKAGLLERCDLQFFLELPPPVVKIR